VLEFNARFGDPEAQLILPLMESSLLEVCLSVCEGRLATPRWQKGVSCGVVLAAPGYPERPQLGSPITGLDRLPSDVLAFHAGTVARASGGQGALRPPGPPANAAIAHDGAGLLTSGGRVLTLVACAESLEAARGRVYEAAPLVQFDGAHYRRDIGQAVAVAV
jgi:phosphoribosylamine--glycine ligase